MWFRLAITLGATVAELQQRMTSAEFAEWMAFYNLEPFGPRVAGLRFATLAQLAATGFGLGRAGGSRKWRLEDFYPQASDGPPVPKKKPALMRTNPELFARNLALAAGHRMKVAE